jgi:signal transduction histidine kinase
MPASPDNSTLPQPRWHLLYFVLAGFDLVTISISLYVNHRIVAVYTHSVLGNQEWDRRRGLYEKVGEWANRVNLPANNLFESGDVAGESARHRQSLDEFDRLMTEARAELASGVSADEGGRLADRLAAVDHAMAAQVGEARQIFELFSGGRTVEAGARMARMDREYARLNLALTALRGEVAAIQAEHFREQAAVASSLRLAEYAIGGLIIVMVLGVTLYGSKLAREVAATTRWLETQRQRETLRAEQMSTVARIATGVAHELRNPLTSIKMLVQSNREEAESFGLPAADLEIIEQEIRRMERCVHSFLEYARPPKPARRPIRLAALVERTCVLIGGRAAVQRVAIETAQPPEPLLVEVDWEQVQQVLLNLVLNALDAMPHGGTLRFELRPAQDGHVELWVSDSGAGIAPDLLPHLFEPFASGKEAGIGLGLLLSRQIAEAHGGNLRAENRSGGGARFILRLPRFSGPLPPSELTPRPEPVTDVGSRVAT